MLRYLTAGESHGKGLVTIIEGLPAGLLLTEDEINTELHRRQQGYGRGGRMQIEMDQVEIISGIRFGQTMGTPVALLIRNRDWENWQTAMQVGPSGAMPMEVTIQKDGNIKKVPVQVTRPRPGHADLPGALKYGHADLRNVLERASARETAARVAAGAIAKRFLQEFGLEICSHVVAIGGIRIPHADLPAAEIKMRAEKSKLRCIDPRIEKIIMAIIDKARAQGNTIGGVFEIIVTNPPVGLGDFVQWDRKLDANLAQALMSIQGIKGVEVGEGFAVAGLNGSAAHDPICFSPEDGYYHTSNHAGGIEGGMTNGENIILRAAMKPIPTLLNPLPTVDIATKVKCTAGVERSDICAVPAAAVVGEAVVAFVLAQEMLIKFGGDSFTEVKERYLTYCRRLKE